MIQNQQNRAVIIWLSVVFFLIGSIVVVGGITRLTRSGLSIVEWKPFTGVIPPIGESQWQAEFEKYKQYPEFKKINQSMNLSEFKSIFFWEYFHRLIGRLIGIVFLLPFLYFLIKKRLEGEARVKTGIAFLLGGAQGLLGWLMVKSGLVDIPTVSHFRLAAHLMLALFIMNYILWLILDFNEKPGATTRSHSPAIERIKLLAWLLTGLIVIQITYGAFTAGLRAGYIYNTFPLMGTSFVPEELFQEDSLFANIFSNMITVQFIHRCLGWLVVLLVPLFWFYSRRFQLSQRAGRAITFMKAAAILQFTLGALTILYSVPVSLGVLHQAGAMLLLSSSVYVNFTLRRGEAAG